MSQAVESNYTRLEIPLVESEDSNSNQTEKKEAENKSVVMTVGVLTLVAVTVVVILCALTLNMKENKEKEGLHEVSKYDQVISETVIPTSAAPVMWYDSVLTGKWVKDEFDVSETLKTVSINDAGSVWASSSDLVHRKSDYTQPWSNFTNSLSQIETKSDDFVVGVAENGKVFQYVYPKGGWVNLPGIATGIVASIGSDGSTRVVGTNNKLYASVRGFQNQFMNEYNSCILGSCTWADTSSYVLVKTPFDVSYVAVANYQNFYVLDTIGQVYRSDGYRFAQIEGNFTKIAISSDGRMVGINENGNLFVSTSNSGSWKVVSGVSQVVDVSISSRMVAVLDSNHVLQFLDMGSSIAPVPIPSTTCGQFQDQVSCEQSCQVADNRACYWWPSDWCGTDIKNCA